MKAMILTKFGAPDGLQLQEVAKPTPNDHEVLIPFYATTVTAADCELRGLKMPLTTFGCPSWLKRKLNTASQKKG